MGNSRQFKILDRSGLRQLGMGVLLWAWVGAALAHPGHDHDSWLADAVHLLSGLAPLLLLLAAGVASALLILSRQNDRS